MDGYSGSINAIKMRLIFYLFLKKWKFWEFRRESLIILSGASLCNGEAAFRVNYEYP